MAGYEWKKLLRYRRGGWIVLVLLLAEWDGVASYQLDGGVTAHRGFDG